MMRSIAYLPKVESGYSINLNIQSAFPPPFENALRAASTQDLTIEFGQSNIVEFYDEFVTARSLLESRGINISVDRIFPDTFGLVNLAYVGARSAKLNWAGLDRWKDVRIKAFRHIVDAGISLTVSRVDAAAAIDLSAQLGFKRFQGFYVDRIAADRAA
jgi:EAL domain-containing protein (putative c-di-GMP-specific phosphodiesterase class I)